MIPKTAHVLSVRRLTHTRSQAGVHFQLMVPKMNLAPGQFVALVGPSGCGKSTLLDILGLVLKPREIESFSITDDTGPIDLTALDHAELAGVRSKHIGYVLQTGGLLPFLTVRQNIALPLRLNRQKDLRPVDVIAQTLGISEQLDKLPSFLSGGQRQRVAIARALVHKPEIVLADEPTAAVDELTAREIRDQFKTLSKKLNTTTIMVTHDRSLIKGQVDRIFSFNLERKTKKLTLSTLQEVKTL